MSGFKYIRLDESGKLFIDSATEANVDSIFDEAATEGIFLEVFDHLQAAGVECGSSAISKERKLSINRTQLAKALNAISPFVLLLKGYAIEHVYPKNTRRFFHDADVIVNDFDELRSISEALAADFAMHPTLLIRQNYVSKRVAGVAYFRPTIPLGDSLGDIEVQIGAFPINLCRYLPYDEVGAEPLSFTLGDSELKTLNRESQLLVMFAEAANKSRIKLRDLIDVKRLLDSESAIDLTAVVRLAVKYGLFHSLALYKERLSELPEPLPENLARLKDILMTLRLGRSGDAALSLASAFNTWNHFAITEKRRFPVTSTIAAMTHGFMFALNQADKHLPLLRTLDLARIGKHLFKWGFAMHATRISRTQTDSGIVWSRKGRFDILTTTIGSFVITPFAVLTDADMDFLEGK